MKVKDVIDLRNGVLGIVESDSESKEKEILYLFDKFICEHNFTVELPYTGIRGKVGLNDIGGIMPLYKECEKDDEHTGIPG